MLYPLLLHHKRKLPANLFHRIFAEKDDYLSRLLCSSLQQLIAAFSIESLAHAYYHKCEHYCTHFTYAYKHSTATNQ